MQRGIEKFPVPPNPAFSIKSNITSCKILELSKTQKTQPISCCSTWGPSRIQQFEWAVVSGPELGKVDCLGCLHPSLLSTAFSGLSLDRVCVWLNINSLGGIINLNITNHYYFQWPRISQPATLSWQVQHRTLRGVVPFWGGSWQ